MRWATYSSDALLIGRPPAFCSINATALVSNSHSTRRISRQHTVLVRLARPEGFYFLRDLGSTNSTRVGGQPIDRKLLVGGDVIQGGKIQTRLFDRADDRSQEVQSTSENDFECFASTGVNTPATMSPN